MKRLSKLLHSHSGVALITVILIISILVAAVLEMNRSSRADIYDAANISDGIKLTYIAKSGFYGGAALLVNSQTQYDSLQDDWANAEALSVQSKAFFPNGYFIVKIEDEQGKIPLNKLLDSQKGSLIKGMLQRLLEQPEFSLEKNKVMEIVDSIIDWIDADDTVSPMGAESSYYLSLPIPYRAKNAQLDCIEELLMIKGITAEIFAGTKEKPGLSQFVTIYGTGAININTAPKMVLRALDPAITADFADKMDEYRRAKSNIQAIANPLWYKNVPGWGGFTIDSNLISNTQSSYFKIYSTGVTDKMEQSIGGVICRPTTTQSPCSSFQIMSWRQN